jgi:hypothetical protein
MGVGPTELDSLEIWQVAAVLGLADDEQHDTETPSAGRSRPPARPSSRAAGRAMLKARVKAAQEGRDPPRWGPPSATERSALTPLLTFGAT